MRCDVWVVLFTTSSTHIKERWGIQFTCLRVTEKEIGIFLFDIGQDNYFQGIFNTMDWALSSAPPLKKKNGLLPQS
jgi:hypothetical protein